MKKQDITLEIRHVDIDVDSAFARTHMVTKVPSLTIRKSGAIGFELLTGREEIKPYLEQFNGART
tara:strand:+ start:514 stop:708 length:195 start_codon:yes stop_codon:yes gene_type:complete